MLAGVHDCKWYALFVKSHHEYKVEHQLTIRNVPTFLPVYKSVFCYKQRQVCTDRVLFPGYVFCRIDLNRGPKLYTIPGVVRLLGANGVPTALNEDEIEAIRTIVAKCAHISSCEFLSAGDDVHLIDGPLRGLKGVYFRKEKSDLIVSFPLLRRAISIRVPPTWVGSAGGRAILPSTAA